MCQLEESRLFTAKDHKYSPYTHRYSLHLVSWGKELATHAPEHSQWAQRTRRSRNDPTGVELFVASLWVMRPDRFWSFVPKSPRFAPARLETLGKGSGLWRQQGKGRCQSGALPLTGYTWILRPRWIHSVLHPIHLGNTQNF